VQCVRTWFCTLCRAGCKGMSATAALAVRTWKVGRYTCTLTLQQPQPGAVVASSVEWAPCVPRALSADERKVYREGRNAVLADLAAQLGISVAVVDL
jgi:hypothetical protein